MVCKLGVIKFISMLRVITVSFDLKYRLRRLRNRNKKPHCRPHTHLLRTTAATVTCLRVPMVTKHRITVFQALGINVTHG